MSNADDRTGNIEATLSAAEKKALIAFQGREDKVLTPEVIQEHQEFASQVEVMNALSWLRSKLLVNMKEVVRESYTLGKEGKDFLTAGGTPEWVAVSALATAEGGEIRIGELGPLLRKNVSVAIGWLRKKQWADIRKEDGETILTITDTGRKAVAKPVDGSTDGEGATDPDLAFLGRLEGGILAENVDEADAPILKALLTRKGVVKTHENVLRQITLTPKGKELVQSGIEIKPEVSAITPELIKSGRWKEVDIRPYDITAYAPKIRRGTLHPLTILLEEIREIFISMGFKEIQGEYVQSCFWNMDTLFIPQDHPARELQDTFYLDRPKTMPIGPSNAEAELMETVKAIHETGGNTGSTGWQYQWSQDEAERALLRTHTTVNTIRYLSEHPDPPVKVFSLGRVFRKEAIDSTHLPEFHQIEGICMEERASFGMLIGLLKEFYSRMGFDEIRFRPGYFPYTEPSMEVEVFFHGKWLELGGSGIFRKEVTDPYGVKHPVLAWGLGLERLAMLRLGLKDIRELYISDIEWLQEAEGKL